MNKPSLDGFSCSLSRQTSSNKAQASSRVGLYSIEALLLKNCTCALPGTPKEFVFTDSSHFVPLSAVEYCKGSKISLLSTCLLLLSQHCILVTPSSDTWTCWLFLWGLQVLTSSFVHCSAREETISAASKERMKMWSHPLLHMRNYTRRSSWRHPRYRTSFSVTWC